MKNELSVTIAPADKATLLAMPAQIRAILTFLISKTAAEREQGFKLGDGTQPFLDKAVMYGGQNPTMIPITVDAAEWTKDSKAAADLLEIIRAFAPVFRDMNDTYGEFGIEALMPALTFKGNVKELAKHDFPGAKEIHDDLVELWPGKKGKTPKA